jgi:YaiO family outer membrane protein
MLMWMVLTLAVAAAPQAPAVQPPGEPRAQAEQLARSGSYRAALERFQAIVAKNPDDLEARVWIARLHGLMGNDRRAVDVYESIIATNPRHVDALIGLGDALIRLGRLRQAADALTQAEAVAPENATLLATQGRLHEAMGHPTLSAGYYERALAIDPSAATTRAEYEAVRRERAHRVEVGYVYEHFNIEDMPDPHAATGAVNLMVNDRLRVEGTVQYERRFSRNETRGGGGLEWRLTPALTAHGGALFAGDTVFLPKTDGYGGIGYRRGRATWTFDLRFAEFETVNVQIGGAGLQVALPRKTAAWARYYRFSTDYEVGLSDIVQSWVLGASGHPGPGWTLGAEFTRGPDQLELLTIDRTGPFEANTYSGFLEYLLTPMASLNARYDYQDRPDAVRVHRASVRLIHRF